MAQFQKFLFRFALVAALAFVGACGDDDGEDDTTDTADTGGNGETDSTGGDADDSDTGDGPEIVEGDYCSNGDDIVLVEAEDLDPEADGAQTITSYAQGCGIDCIADADPSNCSVECIVDKTGLSADCAGCYGGMVTCSINKCLAKCVGDPASDACRDCQAEHCLDDFYACSGIAPADDTEGDNPEEGETEEGGEGSGDQSEDGSEGSGDEGEGSGAE